MKTKTQMLFFGLALLTSSGGAAPLGSEFTYSGRLTGQTGPSSGSYDIAFRLNLALSGGTALVSVTNFNVAVANGLFTTSVDFGPGFFNGTAYWLQIDVRPAGNGAFSPLTPRQPLSPTPNASYATLAGTMQNGSVTSAKLASGSVTTSAIVDNSVTAAKIASGQVVKSLNGLRDDVTLSAGANMVLTPSGNGLTISGSSDWQLGGNVGTTPGTQFLGTTDNQPLVLKVNNATALRIDPAANGPNMVGGLAAIRPTVITSGVRGAVVGGGGAPAGPVTGNGGGDFHAIYDSDGTIGGGFGNKVGNANANVNDAPFGTVGGGVFNGAANYASTVAGGDGNFAGGVRAAIGGGAGNQALSDNSAVAGGANNVIRANSQSATIAGGQSNLILSNSPTATIAGGLNNSVSPGDIGYVSAKGATIAGGEGNTIFGFGGFPEGPLYNEYGTIGGGYSNTVNVSYGTVPGGYLNTVLGDFGFAAGSRAVAGYGCFVWADASSASPFQSTAGNQFGIRAAGGVRLDPNTTSLFFGSGAKLWPDQGGSIELGDSLANGVTPYIDFHYGIGADQDYSVRLINDAPGFLTCSGIFRAPVVQQTSDRNAKNNFKPINAREVLEKVGALPISQWEFKQYPGTRHLGPTAQDFKAAFNLGTDDKHIATVDSEGVALAAIQGLNQKVEEKDSEIRELRTRVEKLEKLLTRELHAKGN